MRCGVFTLKFHSQTSFNKEMGSFSSFFAPLLLFPSFSLFLFFVWKTKLTMAPPTPSSFYCLSLVFILVYRMNFFIGPRFNGTRSERENSGGETFQAIFSSLTFSLEALTGDERGTNGTIDKTLLWMNRGVKEDWRRGCNEIFSTMDVLILCVGPSIGIFSIFPLSSRFFCFSFLSFFLQGSIALTKMRIRVSFVYVH